MPTDARTARRTTAAVPTGRATATADAAWVLRVQQRLAHLSQRGDRLTDLRHLLGWPRLVDLAAAHVLGNVGARTPGVDGLSRADFPTRDERKALRDGLLRDFRQGSYRPLPVRRVYVPKPNKPTERRPLGIPAIRDRVAQECLRLLLEPVYEGCFHPHSYGFRPYRSTHHAMVRLWDLCNGPARCEWIVEGDIRGFFDHVDHEILQGLLARKVADRRVLAFVHRMLKADVLEAGELAPTDLGTPQGGVLSPLLANVYLNELDRYVAQKYEAVPATTRVARARAGTALPCFIVRYADDFCVAVRGDREQAAALTRDLQSFLKERLRLDLSEEKTKVTHVSAGLDFLGFHFRREVGATGKSVVLVRPSRKATQRFRGVVRKTVRLARHTTDALWLRSLVAVIRGWGEYYRRANSARTFVALDSFVWWRVLRTTYRKMRATSGRRRGASIRQHYVRSYKPYRYDVHPAIRRHGGANYGLWLDEQRQTALIVPKLSHLHIDYAGKFPQGNPYVAEERARLEANRQLARLRAELTAPPGWWSPTYGPEWPFVRIAAIRRARGRCDRCGRQLRKGRCEVHHAVSVRRFRRTRTANLLDNLQVLCTSCHRKVHGRGSEAENPPT